jgi:hypothetical protein
MNLKIKFLATSIIVLFLFFEGRAQYNLDFGINFGAANYLGDVGGGDGPATGFINDMQFTQTRGSFGAFARYRVYGGFSASAHFNYVRIQNADSLSGEPTRNARNINFRNNMFEMLLRAEYAFFKIPDLGGRGYYQTDMSFYTFAGAGLLIHNPQGFHEHPDGSGAQWFNLRDFNTEGPRNQYGRTALVMPIGMGINVTYKKTWRFGMEVSWRFTNTDYLDDTSTFFPESEFITTPLQALLSAPATEQSVQRAYAGTGVEPPSVDSWRAPGAKRGNPDSDDGYLLVNFSISYVIRGQSSFAKSRYSFLSARRKTKARF